MATSHRLQTDAMIPAGELLREELESRGMTQKQLAQAMARPAQVISEICRSKKEITAETALVLEEVLGTPAHVWLSLEADYRLDLARKKRLEQTSQVGLEMILCF